MEKSKCKAKGQSTKGHASLLVVSRQSPVASRSALVHAFMRSRRMVVMARYLAMVMGLWAMGLSAE